LPEGCDFERLVIFITIQFMSGKEMHADPAANVPSALDQSAQFCIPLLCRGSALMAGLMKKLRLIVFFLLAASCGAATYVVLKPAGAGDQAAPAVINGIPFMNNDIGTSLKEGGLASLDNLNIKSHFLYLFGCVNSIDKLHYNWAGINDFTNQFIGDKAGDLRIKYQSGAIDDIPLIFGYTLWWREGYNAAPEPFKSDPGQQATLDRSLCVANGIIGGMAPYFLRIVLRDEPVTEIQLRDNPEHVGHPVVDGMTFGNVADDPSLDSTRFLIAPGGPIPVSLSAWLADHSVSSANPMPSNRKAALRDLSRVIYSFPEDLNETTIQETTPTEIPPSYSGPKVKFTGPPEAQVLANVFTEGVAGLLARVDDATGMVHESAAHAANYPGWVGCNPNAQSYFNTSFTRTHFIALLANMGFLPKAEQAIGYFDHWMMYFPKSFPALQIGGKPVPGHATVIANEPHIYFDKLRHRGWKTQFTTRDYGNPETDGHGLLMLSRWRTWVKAGKTKEWIDLRWEAINEAAEWIPWCLDHPELSHSEHGLLYAESEGGMQMESLYCNVPCYFGLLAYAEMAQVSGREVVARRWASQADRLLRAMNAYFPAKLDDWGDVWDLGKVGGMSGWSSSTACVPILEAMELYGYDAIKSLPQGWAQRTQHTYAMLSAKRSPRFCDPCSMGYGQGFLTQSALLLDQMHAATPMAEWTARCCFYPRQPQPYRVPESVIMKSDGSMWARGGDLGNGFQMGAVLVTCQILLGIDDIDSGCLKLMPRLPLGWTGVTVDNWPVRVLSHGKSVMATLSIDLSRDIDCTKMDLKLRADIPIDNVAVRLGPFPPDKRRLRVTLNQRNSGLSLSQSGDSNWGWVRIGAINEACLIQAQVGK
jgi:hypothetical protein